MLCGLLLVPSASARESAPSDRFDVVVIDAGHGGDDHGARGVRGLVEKDLVLDVARRLAERLRGAGLRVVMTREDDRNVPLEGRFAIANDARGDLFLSIHANWARPASARGVETFFASLEASDAEAGRLADRENRAFGAAAAARVEVDAVTAILGDMAASEDHDESQAFAKLAHGELTAGTRSRSRGVKQAPFVVLMGVQMPASLVEIGFVSNPDEAAALRQPARRGEIAQALARAVVRYGHRYDAKRGREATGGDG